MQADEPDLFQEFAVAVGKAQNCKEWVADKFQFHRDVLNPPGCAIYGVDRCYVRRDGTYAPAENGTPGFVIAEGNASIVSKRGERMFYDEIFDLIFVPFARPETWYRRLGATDVLGMQWACAGSEPFPATIYADPLDWLRSGGRGVVILTPEETNWAELNRWGCVEPETLELQLALTEAYCKGQSKTNRKARAAW